MEYVTLHNATLFNNNNNNNNPADKCAQANGKEEQVQEFMYRDTTNVEHEMYDYTGNNCSHRNSNKRFKGKYGSHTKKTFNIFTTKRKL
jgi:hypothetical protein